jgi:hypothetical protein
MLTNSVFQRSVFILLVIFFSVIKVEAQNVAVTDSVSYEADASAMLDVQSSSKGMLVPRLTSSQRLSITNPANGLLVYDENYKGFFYYDGQEWLSLSSMNPTAQSGNALFHIVNSIGDTVFAVYENGVEILVNSNLKTKDKAGGFAISGRSKVKSDPVEYFRVTPDSTRIYVEKQTSKDKAGGFAVSGRSKVKSSISKGEKGGTFALSSRNSNKGDIIEDIFVATLDSTRIYVNDSTAKDKAGGFAVSGRSKVKSTINFLDLTPNNYFIGHRSGVNNSTGRRNVFLGYNAGEYNTEGNNNIFLGYQAGQRNDYSSNNVFIGRYAGFYNGSSSTGHIFDGDNNVFIGDEAGYSNETGFFNVFIGTESGFKNNANYNVAIGYQAGKENESSIQQVFVGSRAGIKTTGRMNTYVGTNSGRNSTSGTNNAFYGTIAGSLSITADNNTFIGNQSAFRGSLGDTVQSYNTFLGSESGYSSSGSIGTGNLLLGYKAGYRNGNDLGDYNVIIGPRSGYNVTGSNQLIIGNQQGERLIYGKFDQQMLAVNGQVGIGTSAINPESKLHIVGNDTLGSVIIAPNEGTYNENSELILAEDDDYTYGMSVEYDGTDNQIKFFGKSSSNRYGPHLTIARTDGAIRMPGVYGDNIGTSYSYLKINPSGEIGTVTSKTDMVNPAPIDNISWFYKLDPLTFNLKNNVETTFYGFDPEKVKQINKNILIYNDKKEAVAVKRMELIPVLVKTIQQQKDKLEQVKEELTKTQKENEKLKQEIDDIKEYLKMK